MFTQSSDMLNKNAQGVKKCEANNKQPYLQYVGPKALISAEAKKPPIKDVSNYLLVLNEIQ